MQQAEDFRTESRVLAALSERFAPGDFGRATQFRGWTVNDVLGHLHFFNHAARLTLENPVQFAGFIASIARALAQGRSILETQRDFIGDLAGPALFDAWRNECERLADAYAAADPKARLKWAGPEMSARSSITARQMETWAHGQELFDAFGETRDEGDRIANILVLGANTYEWTFRNRGLEPPGPAPRITLTLPTGAGWERNEAQTESSVEGSAVDFARVVTQVRNIRDTRLMTRGDAAARWMEIAQCFAGPPVDPPPPGSRFRADRGQA